MSRHTRASGAGSLPAILSGPEADRQIAAFLSRCNRARLAVAYWGANAVKRLGVSDAVERGADIQVVFDLTSGSCNPDEVAKLRNILGPAKVRALDGLHAKAWITDVGCVLGSSNASSNGAGHEAKETAGLIEANLAFPSPSAEALRSWETWFDEKVWKGARPLNEEMLKQAAIRWRWRRSERDRHASQPARMDSLVNRLLKDSDHFRDKLLTVIAHDHGKLSDQAKAALAAARTELQDEAESLCCYENRDLRPGTVILDMHWNASMNRAESPSLRQVLQDDPRRATASGGFITLCREVADFEGLKLGQDKTKLQELTALLMRSDRPEICLSGDEFGRALKKQQGKAGLD